MQREIWGGRFIGAIVVLLVLLGIGWWWLRQPEHSKSASVGAPRESEVEVESTGTVTVDVLHGGRPIEGVGVLLQRTAASELFFTERTDGAGRVWFSDVPPGAYTLVTMHLAYPSVQRALEVVAGPQAITLVLPAKAPAASPERQADDAGSARQQRISGRVVNDAGEPVPRAQVGASGTGVPRFVSSDDQGHFEITGLAGTEVNVFATAPDYAQLQRRGVAVGATGLELVMSKAAELRGTLAYASMPEELHVRLCRFEPSQHKEVCVKHEYQKPPTQQFVLRRTPIGKFDLVFSDQSRELKRIPVELHPGERNDLPLQRL